MEKLSIFFSNNKRRYIVKLSLMTLSGEVNFPVQTFLSVFSGVPLIGAVIRADRRISEPAIYHMYAIPAGWRSVNDPIGEVVSFRESL